MDKTAQVYNLDLRIPVPFGVALDVFRYENYVALANLELPSVVNIRAVSFHNNAETRFPLLAVTTAKMIDVKRMG